MRCSLGWLMFTGPTRGSLTAGPQSDHGAALRRSVDGLSHGRGQATADVFRRAPERIGVEVRVSCGGRWLCVAKQLADDRQSKPEPGANARVSVAKVVDAQAG